MKTVLVISHDEKKARLIKYRLFGYDYKVLIEKHQKQSDAGIINADMVLYDVDDVSDLLYVNRLKEKNSCKIIVLIDSCYCDLILETMQSAADDYVLKPLRENELIAKVRYYMAKSNECTDANDTGGILFNDSDNTIAIEGEVIRFTKSEFRLCKLLAQNCLVTISKESIYNNIYEIEADAQIRTVTEYIYSVRKKFKAINVDPIKTIWGIGYRWVYDAN